VPFVYIVRCADGSLYTGYAKNVKRCATAHNRAGGAKYTSGRRPGTFVYSQWFKTIGAALRREYAMKQWTRAEKDALVARRVRSKRN